MRRWRVALPAAWLAVAPAAAQARLDVVASIEPLAMIAREIGGERVAVTALVPPGASAHTFAPRPSDVARVARARAVLRAGGLDDWILPLLAAAPQPPLVLDLVALDAIRASGDPDPHVWLDPILVRDAIAPAVERLFADLDPAGAPAYAAARADFAHRLDALDAWVRARLAQAPGRRYVALHGAWRRFAARYDLIEVGVVEKFPGREPTPREMARLVRDARAAGVAAILVEPQLGVRAAQQIATELGLRSVLVDPQGDPADPARSRYESLLRFDADAFARALGDER